MNLNTVHKIIAQHFPSTLYRYMKHGKKGNNETDSVNPHLFDHGPHLARNSSKESNATSSTDFCRQTTANSECCVTHCSSSCSPRLLKAAGTSQQQVDSTSLHIMLLVRNGIKQCFSREHLQPKRSLHVHLFCSLRNITCRQFRRR